MSLPTPAELHERLRATPPVDAVLLEDIEGIQIVAARNRYSQGLAIKVVAARLDDDKVRCEYAVTGWVRRPSQASLAEGVKNAREYIRRNTQHAHSQYRLKPYVPENA